MISSRLLLSASAALLLGIGLTLNFAPAEIAERLGIEGDYAALLLQLTAAGLMGLGVINWMSRGNAIGGIYARPLCMGNLLHFTVGAFALGRAAAADGTPFMWATFGLYLLFAVGFGCVTFGVVPASTQGEGK